MVLRVGGLGGIQYLPELLDALFELLFLSGIQLRQPPNLLRPDQVCLLLRRRFLGEAVHIRKSKERVDVRGEVRERYSFWFVSMGGSTQGEDLVYKSGCRRDCR